MKKEVDPLTTGHRTTCSFFVAANCAIPIECEHGYDCCPMCDPCTCEYGIDYDALLDAMVK